ncbi:hypothetical protein Tco_1386178 [Tanacetum coccineum]
MEQMTSICDMVGQYMQKKEEDKRITEDQVAKDRYLKIPICYDDDDDEESSIPLKDIIIYGLPPCVAITPVLLTEEPVDSLIMENEHLDTIPATESDERVVVEYTTPFLIILFRDYEAFYLNDDHIKEKSSGSTTTHADFSQYDSFIFKILINPFPPADRSDFYHEEFAMNSLTSYLYRNVTLEEIQLFTVLEDFGRDGKP